MYARGVFGAVILISLFTFLKSPGIAQASFFNLFSDIFASHTNNPLDADTSVNSQTMPLLKAVISPDNGFGKGGGDITVVNGDALASESGPLGTIGNIDDQTPSHQISLYTVRDGDTISQIAKMFNVSINTILWANNLTSHTLTVGQSLVILPITGTLHVVSAGETLQTIAKKYNADVNEIVQFNDLSSDTAIAVGDTLTIPNAEVVTVQPTVRLGMVVRKGHVVHVTEKLRGVGGIAYQDYYTVPVYGIITQGLHGYNAVDIGAPVGTPIYAAAGGDVIISKMGGWNGGYGNYVVISHPNDTQTLYGHMVQTIASQGERVIKGQLIGYVGSTGNSTGPHCHFEVRGAQNPFGALPVGTHL